MPARNSVIGGALFAVLCVVLLTSTVSATPGKRVAPKAFVVELHDQLKRVVAKKQKLAVLHATIGDHLVARVDFPFMSERILGKETWKSLSKAKRTEFLDLLQTMLQRSYVKRFRPRHTIEVRYEEKLRSGKKGRVQVRTEIKIKRTRADVWYSLRPVDGSWRIYDIVVDEASQLRTYRRSFRKVLKKDGWNVLIQRMKKSAGRT